ncbi:MULTISPECIES: CAAD domain-containing protein [Pseudanabaena]|uniref:Cyanobacterial aminoacyl-tRNA synthetase CAAD domain-containing protein n=2 Tax=Pseudanabaena TaxID=1152 RepID=L8N560_9CYAN|nr:MULTISPECIES: CAAD domain-containing protein [Pseudanabaena]ELS33830.1 hypothetical protein Pse7429DRAFT_1178 [Pseudanabaena biceps PCC 7429]MDG3493990.1 CAAD domain-containing protein [Pseudanabaena catenata USMAC16]
MEPQETTDEATVENGAEVVEVAIAAKPIIEIPVKPLSPTPEIAKSIATSLPPTNDSLPESNPLWEQVQQLWQDYFGEGKKDNLTLAIALIAAIPFLIATSALLEFLNKLPLLPSIFELVGFGYSLWFVYRYLLLASSRKELIDGIAAWKNKVFG